jgi:hypothetical protein
VTDCTIRDRLHQGMAAQRPVRGLPHYGLIYGGDVLAEDLTM